MTTITTTISKTKIKGENLEQYLQVLLGASGITEEQAKICLLYALCTYRDDLNTIPILAIMGMTGTGKSTLLNQMLCLVNEPKISTGTTFATVRNEMDNCKTYIIDEADKISESLLLHRTDREISKITYNKGTGHGWEGKTVETFGATILARRNPFRDSAVRNRAIVIWTKDNPGGYEPKLIPGLKEIAQEMQIQSLSLGSGRIRDTWMPLLEITKAIDVTRYEESVNHAIEAEHKIFSSGQDYEASKVVLSALDKLTWNRDKGKRLDIDIELSELTSIANDIGDVKLIKKQVEELLISDGFKVTFTHGIKLVRSDVKLLENLLSGC